MILMIILLIKGLLTALLLCLLLYSIIFLIVLLIYQIKELRKWQGNREKIQKHIKNLPKH